MTTIDSVIITDIDAVQKAVSDLKQEGINIELIQNSEARFYMEQTQSADYVVKLCDGPYDLALNAVTDTYGDITHYDLSFDPYANYVKNIIGISSMDNKAHISRFSQAYAKHAAINSAVSQGFSVQECYMDDHGTVQLALIAV